jgi:hypothetical protein
MKEAEYFIQLQTSVVITEEYNIIVNSNEYLTVYADIVQTDVVITGFNCTVNIINTCHIKYYNYFALLQVWN